MRFVQDGTVDADISHPSTGPYLTIAQEIAAYDDRNYPGIPPANPAKAAVRLPRRRLHDLLGQDSAQREPRQHSSSQQVQASSRGCKSC